MTTIDAVAAGRLRKLVFAGIAGVIAIALGGCETSGNLLGQSGPSTALATPPDAPAAAATAPQTSQSKIAIAPVIGAPDAVGKQLQSQLGTAVAAKNIGVANGPADKADYTLRGYVVSAREKSGTKVSYIWDVTDPAGKRVNRITGEEILAASEGKDSWASVSPQVVQSIADKTAASFATWLPSQKSVPVAGAAGATGASVQTAAATPADSSLGATKAAAGGPTTGSIGGSAGSVTAIVPSVTGAPGDGGVALTSALQRELTKSGVSLANAPGGGVYKVEGKVAVGEAKDGKQPIQIDWNVKDPAGKKLGTVSQKNEIPQGSLDGAWGKTADAAAAAAAQGILKLLPQQKSVN